MKLQIFLLTCIFSCLAGSLIAQNSQDVVYLKNGSVLKGTIIETTDTSTVGVEIIGGSVFIVKKSDIDRIAEETAKVYKTRRPPKITETGLFGDMLISLPLGVDEWGGPLAGFNLDGIAGYKFKSNIRLGLGTGINYYGYNATFMPAYLHFGGDFYRRQFTPMYFVNFGYGPSLNFDSEGESYKGGIYLNFGLGFRYFIPGGGNIGVFAGYQTQSSSVEYAWDPSNPYTEFTQFNRLRLGVSLGF